MALIRYLTVRVKKHDLEENYFGEKSSLESKQKWKKEENLIKNNQVLDTPN